MTSKTITYFFLAFIAVLGWNSFLIKRDIKMFDAYDKQARIERVKNPLSNSLETWCDRQLGWHPNCNVK
jgi:hypothetical protein